jgi:hypothetical protein
MPILNTKRRRAVANAYGAKRRKLVADMKQAAGCADCGYDKHPEALQFDHVRGRKLFNIATHVTDRWERLLAEIAKCEVVCANCHSVRTYRRSRNGRKK